MVDISNVINVSESTSPAGLGTYNVNDILYLSDVQPIEEWTGESFRYYKTSTEVGKDFGTDSKTYQDAVILFGQKPNILAGGGSLIIAPLTVTGESPDETIEDLSAALTRLKPLVYWGGWLSGKKSEDEEILNAAKLNETLDSIYVFCSGNQASFTAETGIFDKISSASLTRTKCLYYGDTDESLVNARAFAAAYVGRSFSVNFLAQNSTITMNLKDLVGITPDSTVTETLYKNAANLGVDLYVSYNGLAKVVSNGVPLYFDSVYNRLWFIQKLKVEMFNSLATTSTKIPQTEPGMDKLKTTARKVCQAAVYNGFLAPGTWNGSDTFGNQDDFYRNIEDFGFYIYSAPVNQQTQTERQTRRAPVIQIAGKEAGAIHGADLIVNFEV